MRPTILPVLLLLGNVIALSLPLVPRDASVITASLKRVITSLTELENGMKQRRQGGTMDEAVLETNGLIRLGRGVVEELRFGSREIDQKSQTLNIIEATSLYVSIDNLTTVLRNDMNGWIDSKKMVVAAGKTNEVLNLLRDASSASRAYSDSIQKRLGSWEQPVAQLTKGEFQQIIDKAVAAYT
jgi:hypothetical protein